MKATPTFRALVLAFALAAGAFASAARAEVAQSGPSGVLLSEGADVDLPPQQVRRAIMDIHQWWSPAHTYSGEAKNLSLDPQAGGCFCETWEGHYVEHARLAANFEQEGVYTIRLLGALGPLQEMGVSGVLTFTIRPREGGSRLAMTYRVAGDPVLGLERLASPVDQVMSEQFDRLTRYIGAGTPR